MKRSSLLDIILTVAAGGLEIFERTAGRRHDDITAMCKRLLSLKGEASAISLAHQILTAYQQFSPRNRLQFFERLLREFLPDTERLNRAVARYQQQPNPNTVKALEVAAESPRQDLFRLLNMGPDGTASIVSMRQDLRGMLTDHPHLKAVDDDLLHLLQSWFNRGFLHLDRISWKTPAFILEKLIAYESVHEIRGWDDLRRRLADDRRCFGFFHPALPDEPLIFVEVALTRGLPSSIQEVLSAKIPAPDPQFKPDAAIFYSINNCQPGLASVSFGNFLIKQVTDSLAEEMPSLKYYATLSPIPGFRAWLNEELAAPQSPIEFSQAERACLSQIDGASSLEDDLKPLLLHLCAYYLLNAKRADDPRDPVARFHLRNGASLERINWLGDRSEKGLRESAGLLVNYLYDRKTVARNHEWYVNDHEIVHSSAIETLLKKRPRASRASHNQTNSLNIQEILQRDKNNI
jgi:malonyl-CoA decarboxylase